MQVALMCDIYRLVETVVFWLGSEEDDSEDASNSFTTWVKTSSTRETLTHSNRLVILRKS